MLRTMKDLEGYEILATDGIIGHVRDFYFDDVSWVVRYLIVDTGNWLSSRKVLISPIAIGKPDWENKTLPVLITKEQVRNSPVIDTDKPVSRQHEIKFFGYYGFPFYWEGTGLWGGDMYPNTMMPAYEGYVALPHAARSAAEKAYVLNAVATHEENDDPHLRSCRAVIGYHIEATDGDIGHVQGLLVDEETWAIRYFVVDTRNWWLGHHVLISPQWIREVSWPIATVSLSLARLQVQNAPPYDSSTQLDRVQEINLHQHYGREGYWRTGMNKNDTAVV